MKFNICGKGDLKLIKSLKKYGFSSFELYLSKVNDLSSLNTSKLTSKIISVHNPKYVIISKNLEKFNIIDKKEIGNKSFESLRKLYLFSRKKRIPNIVLHNANFDSYKFTKKQMLDLLINRLNKLGTKVNICIENDAYWLNQEGNNRCLIDSYKDLLYIIKKTKSNIKICFDIEHLYLTVIFNVFRKTSINSKLPEAEIEIKEFILNNEKKVINKINETYKEFIKNLVDFIFIIHLCGTDYYNYFFNPINKLPFIGEHLPLNYFGKSYNKNVMDRLNLKFLIDILKKTKKQKNKKINIVLEIGTNPYYNYLKEMKKSKDNLVSCIKSSII
ncbi:TIM barrel protein [Candidatus Woesearchaeota archaeon]|nr:TIM barrel protein [Candidatus Woesearchaeota archaeon]